MDEAHRHLLGIYVFTEADAAAIREAYETGGELSAAVELRRRFPGITDNATAREQARRIAAWTPLPPCSARRRRGKARASRCEDLVYFDWLEARETDAVRAGLAVTAAVSAAPVGDEPSVAVAPVEPIAGEAHTRLRSADVEAAATGNIVALRPA
jgi:hypothetical protein